MRQFLKRVVSFFLVPITKWYLRKPRVHHHKGIRVVVFPGVFHPGFFSSTHFLIRHLDQQELRGKRLLELGSGTGLISLFAASRGAHVVAVDISKRAIENTMHNVKRHRSSVEVIQSDLFDKLESRVFDWIVINPPYYAKPIANEADLAWHCGEDFGYFKKLFASLNNHIHGDSVVLMILTQEGCDVATIFNIADANSFYFELLQERRSLLDGKDFLFRIRRPVRQIQ